MAYIKSIPATSLLILLINFKISISTTSNIIPITKCCPVNESYVIGFDSCQAFSSNDSSSTIFQQYDPPIYSIIISSENRTLIEDASSRIQLEINLSTCPNGLVHNVSTDFFLYENGSLSIPQFGIRRTHGEFCIDEFETFDPQEPVKITARFCVPDSCLGVNCIRKCCPKGMELYISDGNRIQCRVTTDPSIVFDHFVFQNNLSDASPDSYVVRNGVAPKCVIDLLEYWNSEMKPFSIMKNGSMSITSYLPEINQVSDYYCIDFKTEFDRNQTVVAAIFCLNQVEGESTWILIFSYFLLTSSVFLIATFVVYALIPEMRNLHGLFVMCQVASLAVAYICIIIINLNPNIDGVLCIVLATVMHFFFLSTFSWISVIGFYTWWIFRNLRPTTERNMNNKLPFLYGCLYGWGLPLVIVLIGKILDIAYYDRQYDIEGKNPLISNDGIIRPDFGVNKCWFASNVSIIAYFYGPISFLILANVVLFVLTTISLYRASKDILVARKQEATQKFRVIFSLFVLMGIPWIVDIVLFFMSMSVSSWPATEIFYILTGVIAFILFICKPTVWSRLRNRFPFLERLDASFHQHLSGIRIVLGRHSPAEESGSNNHCDSSSAQQHPQQTASSSLTPTTSQSSNHFEFNISTD